jgi:hypothetical protein
MSHYTILWQHEQHNLIVMQHAMQDAGHRTAVQLPHVLAWHVSGFL